jgi:hypothetical protein
MNWKGSASFRKDIKEAVHVGRIQFWTEAVILNIRGGFRNARNHVKGKDL